MGVIENNNNYIQDIRNVLYFKIGSPLNILWVFIGAPFIFPIYDTLGLGANQLRILPSFEEFIVIEIIAVLILIIRLYRDYRFKRIIFPESINRNCYIKAIEKLEKLKLKPNIKQDYIISIQNLIDRNTNILKTLGK